MNVNINKFIFGSAGFGMPEYGFSSLNRSSSHNNYLKYLYNSGLRHIDTAPSYGHSESTIGIYHQNNVQKFNVWTKVDSLSCNCHETIDKVYESVRASLTKMNIKNVECLYLHQNDIKILEDKFIQKALKSVKQDGLANKIGVSIYKPEELKMSLSSEVYDVIQLPVSVANSYLYNIAKENRNDKILVARSIFLQGALLNLESQKKKFNFYNQIKEIIKLLRDLASANNLDYFEMLIAYVNSLDDLNYLIISSRNKKNIQKILKKSKIALCKNIISKINKISENQYDWNNPRNWVI